MVGSSRERPLAIRFSAEEVDQIDEVVEHKKSETPGLTMSRSTLIRIWVLERLKKELGLARMRR